MVRVRGGFDLLHLSQVAAVAQPAPSAALHDRRSRDRCRARGAVVAETTAVGRGSARTRGAASHIPKHHAPDRDATSDVDGRLRASAGKRSAPVESVRRCRRLRRGTRVLEDRHHRRRGHAGVSDVEADRAPHRGRPRDQARVGRKCHAGGVVGSRQCLPTLRDHRFPAHVQGRVAAGNPANGIRARVEPRLPHCLRAREIVTARVSMPAKSSPSPTTAASGGNNTRIPGWRDAFIDASAILAIAVVSITEGLSGFEALTRTGILSAWGIVALALAGWFLRTGSRPALVARARIPELGREDKYCVAFVAFICLVCLYLAIASPPNAPDAGSYHVPRVLRWIQEARAAFYPTHIARQLWIGPGWEYFAVHLQLLAGTFPVTNLVQWTAMIATPAVVSVIARELGAARRGQLLAALFTIS